MKKALKAALNKENFFPSIIGAFFNPFYFARKGLYVHIKSLAPAIKASVLDVGCGSKPYRELFHCDEYIGMEIDTPEARLSKKADVFYDGIRMPFTEGRFDAIIASQVLEHVFEPDRFIKEINRILKPGGSLLITVPFVWDEHERPIDYARYSSFGLGYLLEKHGFQIVRSVKSLPDARLFFQLINCSIYKKTCGYPLVLRMLATCTVMAAVNIVGEIVWRMFPKNPDLYLDNVVLARKGIGI